jgi:hypothetical protein
MKLTAPIAHADAGAGDGLFRTELLRTKLLRTNLLRTNLLRAKLLPKSGGEHRRVDRNQASSPGRGGIWSLSGKGGWQSGQKAGTTLNPRPHDQIDPLPPPR